MSNMINATLNGEEQISCALNGEAQLQGSVSQGPIIFNDFVIDLEEVPEGVLLTVRKGSDVQTALIPMGEGTGTPGADGGYYSAGVSQTSANTLQFRFTPSKADMAAVDPVTVTLPAGPKGDAGEPGKDGSPGTPGVDGVSPTVSVSKSGKVTTISITDKSGTKTATVNDGATGAAGKTPVKGVDYWTPADQESIVQDVIRALGTPVFGRVADNGDIVLTGELVDGTYTIKYEDADGEQTVIGTLNHTVVPEPTYTNVLPLAIAADGTPYNGGKGWKLNTRLNSSGAESGDSGYEVTGFIPVKANDVVRFSGIEWPVNSGVASNKAYIWLYKSDFTKPTLADGFTMSAIREIDNLTNVKKDAQGNLAEFTISDATGFGGGIVNWHEIAYMRISAYEINDNSIITVNEPITG